MATWQIVLLVIAIVMILAIVGLYFLGKKAEKKKAKMKQKAGEPKFWEFCQVQH